MPSEKYFAVRSQGRLDTHMAVSDDADEARTQVRDAGLYKGEFISEEDVYVFPCSESLFDAIRYDVYEVDWRLDSGVAVLD